MEQEKEELLTLKELWEIFISNIWCYIILVSLSLSIAVSYIVLTPPQYMRSASIMVKDSEKGSSIAAYGAQGFSELGLFQSNTNINNEIGLLTTSSLMCEVVERLGLNYNYEERYNGIYWVDIYNNSPFIVEFEGDDTLIPSLSFDIHFNDRDSFSLSKFTVRGESQSFSIEGQVEHTITTPYGHLRILRTPLFDITKGADSGHYRFTKSSIKAKAKDCLERLTVNIRSKETSIIDLSFRGMNIERSDNILNTLISVYNENWIKDKNEIAFNTSEFIDDRLLVIKQELEKVDRDIANFKSDKLLPDVMTVAGHQLEQSNINRKEQLEIKNQLSMANYILSYIKDDSHRDQLLPSNTGIDAGAIEAQIVKYNDLLMQRNMLLANSSERNPLVADLSTNLLAIKSMIDESIDQHISTLAIQLELLQSEESRNNVDLSSTPKQAQELLDIEREQKIKENLFLYLLQKREENELSQAFSAYNTKVLSLADGSSHPIEPRRLLVLFMAFVVGSALFIVYIYILVSLNTTIQSKRDLEMLVKIPFIGSIPHIAKSNGGGKSRRKGGDGLVSNVVSFDSRDVVNEAFRVVRTNLDFILPQQTNGAVVVQMISMNPGSGKSFMTTNIAHSMALKESRVLIIDLDMRKATLSRSVDAPKVGVGEYLCGKRNDIEALICRGLINENLDVLPVGAIPPNPSELLLKARMGELIDQLKGFYDYIFIDCPPVEIVPDAAIVAKYCDSSIFVVRAGLFDKRLIPDLDAIFSSGKYNSMSLLLNNVRYAKGSYYGHYGYGYGYGEK